MLTYTGDTVNVLNIADNIQCRSNEILVISSEAMMCSDPAVNEFLT